MMFSRPNRPAERGYASVVLLWFVVGLAAAHGVLGTVSPARSMQLANAVGAASQRAGDPAGDRTSLTGQQRLFIIADWRGLALKSLLPTGDGGSAILPASQWYLASAAKPCRPEIAPAGLHEADALVNRARAPPFWA
ncbi:hypothetical protein [Pseudaminobacter soli (ex Li et al. 2025)]|uniref:Uncharacterized protein n=1 Tax=Pseudaminobacter soli (ex Li et al. 2025) TaxID=1295366 RepID=A0A2P7SM82_9HYPH|nr:hypothetical protein [Mesorhizobium soli]PSJ63596.1 hypothetical protein C7I85_00205 [Mesorhizobium soli]